MNVLPNFRQHFFAFYRSHISKRCNLLLFAPLLTPIHFNYGLENTNILSYDKATNTSDLNRLRLESSVEHEEYEALLAKISIDNETRYTAHPSHTTSNNVSIYRAYLEYAGERHFIVLGRQRVPFGVGRIWNPIDVFNPINSFSTETTERKGTNALRYEYAINSLSNIDLTVSEHKSAARLKGFLHDTDLALVGVVDSNNKRDIIGYEAAGELFDTKIELRSEGGSFYNRDNGERSTEFIVGAEYGFKNSLTLLGEYRYNDETKTDYFATSLSYQASPLLVLSLLHITQLQDTSFFTAPSLEYSLGDDMTLRAGALLYSGHSTDEFGAIPDSYYLNFYIHF